MGMWQDNTLQRISRLEDQIQAQSELIEQMSKLLVDVAGLVIIQTAQGDSTYERGIKQYRSGY